ncbi:LD-carboxypeptidase [candidate division KSB1 bacterium]|nr:LD-carboxypeptidase [candidate division KSB1 bacterium]MBL7092535.1 LD-carboxypeptidase [candidate division KSB1 bacterium]
MNKNKKIIKPKQLSNGATIGVVSPASRPSDEQKYSNGIQYLKNLGYKVVESRHVLDSYGYLAGKDRDRIDDLNLMFRDSQIDAVFCSRGGYGVPRIIDEIDFNSLQNDPKIFVGYSDITSLNLAILAKTGLISFSGPMVAVEMGAGIDQITEQNFWKTLKTSEPMGILENPSDLPIQVVKSGRAKGRLLGGCLSLINVVLGTPFCPDFNETILFIEDIEEEPYRVDRYLAQLKMAGVLDRISGLVIGQFVDCIPGDPEKPNLKLEQVFDDYFSDLDIPIISNFAYGHVPVKHTLPVGVQVELDTENGGLIILESAVNEG